MSMRVTEFRVEQARRVLPLAKDAGDNEIATACRQIMTAWLEGRPLIEREIIAAVDAFDPRNS